jgi:hypothetical protein
LQELTREDLGQNMGTLVCGVQENEIVGQECPTDTDMLWSPLYEKRIGWGTLFSRHLI